MNTKLRGVESRTSKIYVPTYTFTMFSLISSSLTKLPNRIPLTFDWHQVHLLQGLERAGDYWDWEGNSGVEKERTARSGAKEKVSYCSYIFAFFACIIIITSLFACRTTLMNGYVNNNNKVEKDSADVVFIFSSTFHNSHVQVGYSLSVCLRAAWYQEKSMNLQLPLTKAHLWECV